MFIFKTLIRDKLVADTTIKGLFNASASGSCNVNMSELQVSATYPNITIDYVGGATTPAMGAEEGRLYLRLESQSGTGTEHAIKNLGRFRSAILSVLDDKSHSATAVVFHIRKTNETGERWDSESDCYYNVIGFNVWIKQNFTKP